MPAVDSFASPGVEVFKGGLSWLYFSRICTSQEERCMYWSLKKTTVDWADGI